MRFQPGHIDVLDALPKELPNSTSDGRFRYLLDIENIEWSPTCICFTGYVVIAQDMATRQITRHTFEGLPSGTFDDDWARVRLSFVDKDEKGHAVEVGVPVGSAQGNEKHLIDVKVDPMHNGIAPVSLGGSSILSLTIRNTSRSIPVQLTEPPTVSTHGTMWKTAPAFVGSLVFPMTIAPQRLQKLDVRLEPIVAETISLSFRSMDPAIAHTELDVHVPYANTVLPGRFSGVPLVVPIRFEPHLPMLGLWLLGGVIIGSLVPLFTGKDRFRGWPRAFGAALVAALIVEVVAMLLAQTKSKVVVLDTPIDPWQSTPVLVLGLGAGILGTGAAKLLQSAAERWRRRREKGDDK